MYKTHQIFVFGSNRAGRHGKGAALHAYKFYGAVYGIGIGRTGSSYAIPTKDTNLKTLSLPDIWVEARVFVEYAKEHPELRFELTRIGCGLAGYRDHQIAPFFKGCTSNVRIPEEWKMYVRDIVNGVSQDSCKENK